MSNAKRRKQQAAARSRQTRLWVSVGVLAVAVVVAVAAWAHHKNDINADVPQPAGTIFALPDRNGHLVAVTGTKSVDLNAVQGAGSKEGTTLQSGQPVVVEYFATWCPYCAYESKYALPDIIPWLKQQGAQFVMVDETPDLGQSVEDPNNPGSFSEGDHHEPTNVNKDYQAALKTYAEHYNLGDQVMLYDYQQTLGQKWVFQGYPTYLIFDKNGKHLATKGGVLSLDQFKQWYQATLNGGASEAAPSGAAPSEAGAGSSR